MSTEVVSPQVAAVESGNAVYAMAYDVWVILKPVHGFAAPGDHPFLDFLMELIQKLAPLLIGCIPMAQRNAAGFHAALKSPNLRQRLGLRWQLRKEIDDPRTANMSIGEIEGAFYTMGRNCTEAKAAALFAQAA